MYICRKWFQKTDNFQGESLSRLISRNFSAVRYKIQNLVYISTNFITISESCFIMNNIVFFLRYINFYGLMLFKFILFIQIITI